LLWSDDIAPALVEGLFASEQFALNNFSTEAEALAYLVSGSAVHTLLIPDSVAADRRLEFLRVLRAEEPQIFANLTVLLIESRDGDATVRPLKRKGDSSVRDLYPLPA